jgi:hypothetical protein
MDGTEKMYHVVVDVTLFLFRAIYSHRTPSPSNVTQLNVEIIHMYKPDAGISVSQGIVKIFKKQFLNIIHFNLCSLVAFLPFKFRMKTSQYR